MIEKHFVTRKISLIQDELLHLEEYANLSFDEIAQDFGKQAIVERVMERIINRAIDINQHLISEFQGAEGIIPKGYKDTFTALSDLGVYSLEFGDSIARSIGTRNLLVHEYDKVDKHQIYTSIKDCLSDYHEYCDAILRFLKKH